MLIDSESYTVDGLLGDLLAIIYTAGLIVLDEHKVPLLKADEISRTLATRVEKALEEHLMIGERR